MTSDAFIFNYAPVLARVLTQNGRLKNKEAIFVCFNSYATVRCKKALSERQLLGMPRSAAGRFFETYRCVGKRCKTFRSAPLMQRTPGVGPSPTLATCETSQVLLTSVSGGFPGVLPFHPTYRLARLCE